MNYYEVPTTDPQLPPNTASLRDALNSLVCLLEEYEPEWEEDSEAQATLDEARKVLQGAMA
jgi:hypothetical protein